MRRCWGEQVSGRATRRAASWSFAAITLSSAALADEASFRAPPECGSEATLRALVRERLPPGVESIPNFRAEIRAASPAYEGELRLEASSPRQLSASSCSEVLEAMAIILALRAERLHAEQSSAEDSEHHTAAVGWFPPELDSELPAATAAVEARAKLTVRPEQHPRLGPSFRVGTGAVILPNVAPGLAFGPAILAGIEWPGRATLRAQLDRSATGSVSTPPASIWTRLSVARLTGCAFELTFLERARLQPCAQLALGRFDAGGVRGGPISSVQQVSRPWLSLGPAVRFELSLNPRLRLTAEAAALFPLVEQTLQFQAPDTTAHVSPQVSSYFGLAAELVLSRSEAARPGIAH